MFTVVITEKGGTQKRLTFEEPEVTIGRVPGNDVVLPKGNVSKRHSRIVLKENRFIVVDLKSTNGTYVNGRKITSPLVVKEGDKIYIGDFILTLEGDPAMQAPTEAMRPPSVIPPEDGLETPAAALAPVPSAPPPLPSRAPEPLAEDIPVVLRSSAGANGAAEAQHEASAHSLPPVLGEHADEAQEGFERTGAHAQSFASPAQPAGPPAQATKEAANAPARPESGPPTGQSALPPKMPAAPLAATVLHATNDPGNTSATAKPATAGQRGPSMAPAAIPSLKPTARPLTRSLPPVPGVSSIPPELQHDLRALMGRLARELEVDAADPALLSDEKRWQRAERIIQTKLGELANEGTLAQRGDTGALARAALHEAMGLGPLDSLLEDPEVCHVVVERYDCIRADRGQGLKLEGVTFSSPQAVLTAIKRLAAQAGESPLDAAFELSLVNGLHVVAVLPARASEGPLLSLRRRPRRVTHLSDLVADDVIEAGQVKSIADALRERRNLLVVGPAGTDLSGIVASILESCPSEERVAVFERGPDIAIGSRGAACFRRQDDALADLLERARHFRPDRLVLHDLSAPELSAALTTLVARGDGSIASMERASAREALAELSAAAKTLGSHGLDATQRAISAVVGLVRDSQGRTKVSGVYTFVVDGEAFRLIEH